MDIEAYEASLAGNSAASVNTACRECVYHNSNNSQDTRNAHFLQLLQEELMYVQPCIRNRCYVKILNFLKSVKNQHSHEIDLAIKTNKQ